MRDKSGFAVSSYALFELPLSEAIDRLIADGWTAIEIMCEDGHAELLGWSKERLTQLQQKGVEYGISWSIHAPISGCNLAAEAGAVREQTLDTMKRCLEIARFLHSTHVVMHAGEIADRLDHTERARGGENFTRAVQLLLPEVSHGSTVLTLENVPPYPKLFGWDVGDLLEVCKAVDSRQLGLTYDVGHAHLIRHGYALEALEQALPYLSALHISDNRGEADEHLAVGEGTIPFAKIWPLLARNGFAGSWVIETRQLPSAGVSVKRIGSQR